MLPVEYERLPKPPKKGFLGILLFLANTPFTELFVFINKTIVLLKAYYQLQDIEQKSLKDAESFQILSYGHTLSIKMTTHQQLSN